MSWTAENLQQALDTWNNKLAEIGSLITQSPAEFRGGGIWSVMLDIYGVLQAIGFALLIVFFLIGVMKTSGSMAELKRPEIAVKSFVRFILAKTVVTYGLDLLLTILDIVQGIISTIMASTHFGEMESLTLPPEIITAIDNTGLISSVGLWAVSIIGSLVITVMSFMLLMTVYGRFFKLYLYAALAPIPLSTWAGEPTQNVGKSFIRSFCGVCLEGAIIVVACIIFSNFAATPPLIEEGLEASTMVWGYLGEIIFNMLVMVGTVKMADRVVHEMMGA